MSHKLCIVIGTRAQLIKTAPVMRELENRNIPYYFLYTAQHRHTFSSTLDDFDVKQPDQALFEWSDEARTVPLLLYWIIRVFSMLIFARRIAPVKNGIVMVHGDTLSALWGAFYAKLSGNKLFHLESGLRSFNFFSPFPEELVRFIVMRLADIYACSTDWALGNVEGLKGDKINTNQNTVVDGLRFMLNADSTDEIPEQPFAIASFHRVENMYNGERLQLIVESIERVASEQYIIFPMHPMTRTCLVNNDYFDRLSDNPNVRLCDRIPYSKFIPLLAKANYLVTDSASMQEEVVWLGMPMLVFRNATERQEGLGENVILSHYDPSIIDDFLDDPEKYRREETFPEESPSSIVVDWLESSELMDA